jgi:hypothetical protein
MRVYIRFSTKHLILHILKYAYAHIKTAADANRFEMMLSKRSPGHPGMHEDAGDDPRAYAGLQVMCVCMYVCIYAHDVCIYAHDLLKTITRAPWYACTCRG